MKEERRENMINYPLGARERRRWLLKVCLVEVALHLKKFTS
jgi:hypothetical protein